MGPWDYSGARRTGPWQRCRRGANRPARRRNPLCGVPLRSRLFRIAEQARTTRCASSKTVSAPRGSRTHPSTAPRARTAVDPRARARAQRCLPEAAPPGGANCHLHRFLSVMRFLFLYAVVAAAAAAISSAAVSLPFSATSYVVPSYAVRWAAARGRSGLETVEAFLLVAERASTRCFGNCAVSVGAAQRGAVRRRGGWTLLFGARRFARREDSRRPTPSEMLQLPCNGLKYTVSRAAGDLRRSGGLARIRGRALPRRSGGPAVKRRGEGGGRRARLRATSLDPCQRDRRSRHLVVCARGRSCVTVEPRV